MEEYAHEYNPMSYVYNGKKYNGCYLAYRYDSYVVLTDGGHEWNSEVIIKFHRDDIDKVMSNLGRGVYK